MATMNKADLTDLIAKWANDNVATLVKNAVETQVAPLAQRQTDWMEKMLTGGRKHGDETRQLPVVEADQVEIEILLLQRREFDA